MSVLCYYFLSDVHADCGGIRGVRGISCPNVACAVCLEQTHVGAIGRMSDGPTPYLAPLVSQ